MTAPVTLQYCVQGSGPGPMAQRLASVTQQLEMERTKTHQVIQQERTKATELELQVRLHCLASWEWGRGMHAGIS